jgi:TRAP-type C4-dicarboxylate transport system permease large subunit
MELGYLMPPMGENLFLSASRFNQSLMQVYRSTLPYLAVLFLVVLGISYAPLLAGVKLK